MAQSIAQAWPGPCDLGVPGDGGSIADRAVAPGGGWYRAESRWGELTIRIDGGPARTGNATLDSARLLWSADRLCRAIELWLGCALDFRPLRAPGTDGWRLRLSDDAAQCELTLLLGRDTGASLPAMPDAEFETIGLTWPELSARLRIASLALGSEETASLGPGAVLLLPASFDEHWACELVVPETGLTLSGSLVPALGSVSRIAPSTVAPHDRDPSTGHRLTVLLDTPVSLSGAHLVAGCRTGEVTLPAALTSASCTCALDGTDVLTGHVGPLGRGFGLFITAAL